MAPESGQTSIMRWLVRQSPRVDGPSPSSRPDETPSEHGKPDPCAMRSTPSEGLQPGTPELCPPSPCVLRESVAGSNPGPRKHSLNAAQSWPANVTLRNPDVGDIFALKRLHQLLLPVPYPHSFFRETTEDEATRSVSFVAVANAGGESSGAMQAGQDMKLIGSIRCRVLTGPPPTMNQVTLLQDGRGCQSEGQPMLYVSTLLLASPWRSYGIATSLLKRAEQEAFSIHGCKTAGAHVWEANEAALGWYLKRGFVVLRREEDYYRRLKPAAAVVVQRDIVSPAAN